MPRRAKPLVHLLLDHLRVSQYKPVRCCGVEVKVARRVMGVRVFLQTA
jgi:hypothetical protein